MWVLLLLLYIIIIYLLVFISTRSISPKSRYLPDVKFVLSLKDKLESKEENSQKKPKRLLRKRPKNESKKNESLSWLFLTGIYYKSGEKTDCGNYRPNSVAKIFENIIYKQLIMIFLNDNEIWFDNEYQSGFRINYSKIRTIRYKQSVQTLNMKWMLIWKMSIDG